MTQLEKWQPRRKVSTARNRKAREGYMNIGHHSGRQNLAHGVIEQMEKGDIEMSTNEQARLDNTIVQLEKIAGLGAVAGAAKKAAGAVSGAAKKVAGGGDNTPAPKTPNFYETANVSRGKGATSRDWKVQSAPAIDTSVYGKERERVRTDVTEEQRAKRTGEPMRAKRQPAKQSGGSRLARAFGASKRGAKRGANWLVDDLKMKKALPSQNMEKVVLSLQKVADGDLFIQNGVVDKLTGGRVKIETNRDKQIIDRGPRFLGVPGVEVQVKKPAMKMDTGKPAMKMTRTMKMGAVPVEKGLKAYAGRVKQRFNAASAAKKRTESYNERRKAGTLGLPRVKEYDSMKMGAGYKKLEKSADGDCGCSD